MGDDRENESVLLAVALLQKKLGDTYNVLVNPLTKNAETIEDVPSCSDDGDIFVLKYGTMYNENDVEVIKIDEFYTVEVKRLKEENMMAHFSCREDWTLPNFIVDGKNQFDNKKFKPKIYMCFNAKLTAFAQIIVKTTYPKWEVETKAGNGSTKKYYVVDPDLIKFIKVEEILK